MFSRQISSIDRALSELQHALATSFGARLVAQRATPKAKGRQTPLDENDRRHSAGLMRINHTGEVCAQALYLGQAAFARDAATREHLLAAAGEETDHLVWCHERLDELASRPSLLNPLWYAGAWGIGALAGLRGDGWNLGFVVETERQVEAHLDHHLEDRLRGLPEKDGKSRAIVKAMKDDEARHAQQAMEAGARELPRPIPGLMRMAANVMRAVAYKI